MGSTPSTILVCAGRRIDAPGATPIRFPLSAVEQVSRRVETLFREQSVSVVVSSAACGADLIVLRVAQRVGIRFRILLPFAAEQFRVSSVVDRPSLPEWNWGTLYDELIDQARLTGDLKVLEGLSSGTPGYQAVNQALVKEGMALMEQESERVERREDVQVKALIIWDGQTRGPKDLTRHFAEEAGAQGIPVLEVLTCSSS